jgi:RNA polymerase sigma-70 factor (ECF subfamily)
MVRAMVRTARPPVACHTVSELQSGLVALVPELRARAHRLSGNAATAEDLAQDTVVRALRFASQYQLGTNLRAWAFQILFSVFVTRYRRQRRERTALRTLAVDPHAWTTPTGHPSPEQGADLTRATREKLGALPEGFRQAIELVDVEERSYRDAADAMGVPVGTVMSRLHRGRKMLAETMREAA